MKVDIVPGHGGFDPGAYNPRTKVKEADGNLTVALKLAYLLEENNIIPNLSRTQDIACGGATTVKQDVNNQIFFINSSDADIAVCIHFNSSINQTATGVEVLYASYPIELPNEVKLGNYLLEELVDATSLPNRGLKNIPSGIGVIKNTKKPCVLSECAFVSNDKESVWASDDNHTWIIAVAHAKAICRYFGVMFINPLLKEMLELFNDVAKDRWSAEAIDKLAKLKIISGYEDGTFRPKGYLTREELAVVIYRTLQYLGKA